MMPETSSKGTCHVLNNMKKLPYHMSHICDGNISTCVLVCTLEPSPGNLGHWNPL